MLIAERDAGAGDAQDVGDVFGERHQHVCDGVTQHQSAGEIRQRFEEQLLIGHDTCFVERIAGGQQGPGGAPQRISAVITRRVSGAPRARTTCSQPR